MNYEEIEQLRIKQKIEQNEAKIEASEAKLAIMETARLQMCELQLAGAARWAEMNSKHMQAALKQLDIAIAHKDWKAVKKATEALTSMGRTIDDLSCVLMPFNSGDDNNITLAKVNM